MLTSVRENSEIRIPNFILNFYQIFMEAGRLAEILALILHGDVTQL